MQQTWQDSEDFPASNLGILGKQLLVPTSSKPMSKNNMLLFISKGSPGKDEDPLIMVRIDLNYSCQTGMFNQSWTDHLSYSVFLSSLLVVIMSMLRALQSISLDFIFH